MPESLFYKEWFWRNRIVISNLKFNKLYYKLFSRKKTASVSNIRQAKDENLNNTVLKIIEDLKKITESNNSIFVLVYLPKKSDYFTNNEKLIRWRSQIKAIAEQTDTLFVDLIEELRKQPVGKVKESFIPKEDFEYSGIAGHYTAKGNKYIADLLYAKLLSMPELLDMFSESGMIEAK